MFANFKIDLTNRPREEILEIIRENPIFMQKATGTKMMNARYQWENTDGFDNLKIKGRGMFHTNPWELKARLVENGWGCKMVGRLTLGPIHNLVFVVLLGSLIYFMITNGIKLAGTDKLIPFLLVTLTAMAFFFFLPMGILYLWLIKVKKEIVRSLDQH